MATRVACWVRAPHHRVCFLLVPGPVMLLWATVLGPGWLVHTEACGN